MLIHHLSCALLCLSVVVSAYAGVALFDFEKDPAKGWTVRSAGQDTLERSERFATVGNVSLKFHSPPWMPGMEEWPAFHGTFTPDVTDWTGYDRLVVDLINPTDMPCQVSGWVCDRKLPFRQGREFQNSIAARSYKRMVLPLRSFPERVDLKSMGVVHLFTTRPSAGWTVHVGGMLLLKADEEDPEPPARFYDDLGALYPRRLTAIPAMLRKTVAAAEKLGHTPLSNGWTRAVSANADRIRAEVEAGKSVNAGPQRERSLWWATIYTERLSDAIEGIPGGKVVSDRLLVYQTKPISSAMVLPRKADLDGELTGTVSLQACRGEYESASIVVWAPEDVPSLHLSVSDLNGPADSLIPARNVDIKWVKCWYQGGTAWWGINRDNDTKVLIPELLVNDPTLVRVDLDKETNELKMRYPDGPKYRRIDNPNERQWWAYQRKGKDFPVRDSAHFLPGDLKAGHNQQVWITVKVPDDAAPGDYAGRLSLTSGDRKIGQLPFTLRVLPFELSPARTRYDLNKPFDGSIFYFGELYGDGRQPPYITSKWRTEEQFRAELKTMREHGINAPFFVFYNKLYRQEENEQGLRRHLAILKEMGFANQPLYMGESSIGNPTEPEKLAAIKTWVSRVVRIAREYDFTDVYFYGIDEATGERLLSQRAAWKATHEAGGKILVAGWYGLYEGVGDLLDLPIWGGHPRGKFGGKTARVDDWHANGARLWNYSNPQTPAENPELYRRNYGLLLWASKFDGFCPWMFLGGTWNDFALPKEGVRAPNIAYPTLDGVITTLALEGLREAKDDVRYATTLRKAAALALAGRSAKAKQTAEAALRWLDSVDPDRCDLDETRARMIEWILKLR